MSEAPKKSRRAVCIQVKHPWLVLTQSEDGSWQVARSANGYSARKLAASLVRDPEEVESYGHGAAINALQEWLDNNATANVRSEAMRKNRKG